MMEVEYDSRNRVKYHPDYHFRHGRNLTEEEKEYLCYYFGIDHILTLSYALGRTQTALKQIYDKLRDKGLVEGYRQQYRSKLMGEIE